MRVKKHYKFCFLLIIFVFAIIGIESTANASIDFTKVPLDEYPPGGVRAVEFSHNSRYLATANSGRPKITTYKRDGGTFTKLPSPDELPSVSIFCNDVAFSHDSTYLAVAHDGGPRVTIYKRSGDSFAKLPDPDELPYRETFSVTFSHDSTYLVLSQQRALDAWTGIWTPSIIIYKRDGDTFNKLPYLDDTPYAKDIAFSHDSSYMAVAGGNRVVVYKRQGDNFNKISEARLPDERSSVTFSPCSIYLAVTHRGSEHTTVFKRDGDNFTKLPTPDTFTTEYGRGIAFSHDSKYLAIAAHSREGGFFDIYSRSNDTFTALTNIGLGISVSAYDVTFSHDSNFMAVGSGTGFFNGQDSLSIYKTSIDDRIAGATRYDTAIEISKTGWADGSDTVLLARGDNFPDSLAGVSLAYALDAPIVITEIAELNLKTKAEIERLQADKVIILGGDAAVSPGVESELKQMGLDVDRISGENRYETAAEIAEELVKESGGAGDTAFIAYGYNFPDALAAASYGAAKGYPVLLSGFDSLPNETVKAINSLGIDNAIIAGGPAVIRNSVGDQLEGLGLSVQRVYGGDRFDTAVQLSKEFMPVNTERLFISTGMAFPDALAGAVLAAKHDSGILLVDGRSHQNEPPKPVRDFFLQRNFNQVTIFGGNLAVNESIEAWFDDNM